MFAKRTMIEAGRNKFNVVLELTHRTAGEQLAGSRTIMVDEAFGVLWTFDGCQHGQWFRTLPEAQIFFNARNVN